MIQRAVREDVLLDGCLHRALQRQEDRLVGRHQHGAPQAVQLFGKAAEEEVSI